MKLKQQYLEIIKHDSALQGAIAKAGGVSIQMPTLWIRRKRIAKFLDLRILKAICEHTGAATVDELVEQPAAV